MSKEANIAVQTKFGEAINGGDLQEMRNLVAANCTDHDPATGQVAGPEGYINFFTMMRTAFPDMKVDVEQLVADDECVSFAYKLTGTHRGNFMGFPATEKNIKVRGMQISKFKDGVMVERWGSTDESGLLKQIGVSI